MKFYLKIMVLINMQTIRLNFGTKECVEFSVSSVQNSYNDENLLPIVVEEHLHDSYLVNIFGADKLKSVFPVFKVSSTSFFKFKLNNRKSPCLKVDSGYISSFPFEGKVYGLEILNQDKQKEFESKGGHSNKILEVYFSPDKGEDVCGIFSSSRTEIDGCSRTETDGIGPPLATVALNNSSTETYTKSHFREPKSMNKRTFYFVFKQTEKMMDNLYLG
jgi:hypothetical protein